MHNSFALKTAAQNKFENLKAAPSDDDVRKIQAFIDKCYG